MGGARWDSSAYATYSLSTTRSADGARLSTQEVFKERRIHADLDPTKIRIRESCDSEANPNSRPIILGLDVTGSMGMIANEIAAKELGALMGDLIDKQTVADPHIMFMGIGDVKCDRAPLQASQFEADIRIAQQLSQMFMEGGGGGNSHESYTLPWYLAAFMTKIDSFDKRNVKGILCTFGDEMPPPDLSVQDITKTFGSCPTQHGFTTAELYREVSKKWDVFHFIVEEGNYAYRNPKRVYDEWFKVIGNRAIRLTDYTRLSAAVRAVIAVNEGASPEDVIDEAPRDDRDVIEAALYGFNQQ